MRLDFGARHYAPPFEDPPVKPPQLALRISDPVGSKPLALVVSPPGGKPVEYPTDRCAVEALYHQLITEYTLKEATRGDNPGGREREANSPG